jgi:hypothetical protein
MTNQAAPSMLGAALVHDVARDVQRDANGEVDHSGEQTAG